MDVSTYQSKENRTDEPKTDMSGDDNNLRQQSSLGLLPKRTSAAVGLTQSNFPVNASLFAKKIKCVDLILLTTQLSVMLESGVVLSDAIDTIAEQMEKGTFKSVLQDVSEVVKAGEPFSIALSAYPKVFDPMFVSMVKASEASGKMTEMLNVLSGYLQFEFETRKKIKGALTYPFIMAIMAVAASGSLMFFVLPRFMRIYEARGATLPKLTQVLVSISSMLCDPQARVLIITSIIAAATGLFYFCSTKIGIKTVDYIKVNIPIFNTMFIDMVLTRSMRIMATMINTGVNLLDAIDVIKGSCRNSYFTELWESTDTRIRDGYQLSESIQLAPNSNLIAPSILHMIRAGEKSGKLGFVCDKISVFYENKLNQSIRNVTTLIEPLMIIILGSIIGTLAIALLLPVFKISSVISH